MAPTLNDMRRVAITSHILLFTGCLAILNLGQLPFNQAEGLLDTRAYGEAKSSPTQRRQANSRFFNNNTSRFSVDGTAIPEVNFDLGESYAGLLPIGDANDTNQLFYWFFPSENPAAEKEILIWLTGGPGCSSVGELLQENGPFLWQPGVFKPVKNKWSWHRLTNVVWVDQPVGSGFSQGEVTARDEFDVARQFMGFWRNFVELYSLQGFKVYITGSSYSGLFSPYVAHEMIEANDQENFNVGGMMIFDALYSAGQPAREVTAVQFTDRWKDVLQYNQTFDQAIHAAADACGYTDYLEQFLVFPPSGTQPTITSLPGISENGTVRDECSMFGPLLDAAFEINPCFSIYSVLSKCPRRFDPLGFSDGTNFMPEGAGPVYFNRPDVKAAINAPADTEWEFCSSDPVFVDDVDLTLDAGPGSLPVLPRVIEATQNVILGHGAQDFVLPEAGALLALQNMTWGSRLGFQAAPTKPLVLPLSNVGLEDLLNQAPGGTVGTWTEERGLTYFSAATTGHFLTMEAPSLAFRALEILLGRVENFDSAVGFTTEQNGSGLPPAQNVAGATAQIAGDNGIASEAGVSGSTSRTELLIYLISGLVVYLI